MKLDDLLGVEQIVPEMKASKSSEAIDELIAALVLTGKIRQEESAAISALVHKREFSMSTGIGFGVAVPHAETDLLGAGVAVFGRSSKGIDFNALDNQPVKLVVLFVASAAQREKRLHTLATIARLLHHKNFRAALESAPDAHAIFKVINGQIPVA